MNQLPAATAATRKPVLTGQGSLPPAVLMQFQVISPTFGLAAALAGGLLAVDSAACLVVTRLLDRERLITGARPSRGIPAAAAPQNIRPRPNELSSVTPYPNRQEAQGAGNPESDARIVP